MQANAKFLAVETALASSSDQELAGLDTTAIASRIGPVTAAGLTREFLENAKAVILRRRADARRRSRIESLLPAIQAIWPKAQIEDSEDRLVVWLDGKPAGPGQVGVDK